MIRLTVVGLAWSSKDDCFCHSSLVLKTVMLQGVQQYDTASSSGIVAVSRDV